MAAIQHKDIPDSQLHEPKGIVSAPNKTIYVSGGAATGAWRRIVETDLDYSDKTKNVYGWNDISDSQYTTGSPLAIGASTRTQLPNNGLAIQTDQTRLGTLWSSNAFNISDLNSVYISRVSFKCKAVAAASAPYVIKLELQSDNGPLVIASTEQIIKGGSYENAVAISIPFYMGTVVNNFPLKLFVTPDTAVTIYDIGFLLQRTYKES